MFGLKNNNSTAVEMSPVEELKARISATEQAIAQSEAELSEARRLEQESIAHSREVQGKLNDDRSNLSALEQQLRTLELDEEIEQYVKDLRPLCDKINALSQELAETVIQFRELAAQGQRGGIPEKKRVLLTDRVDLRQLPKSRYQMGTRGFLLIPDAQPVAGE